MIVGSEAYLPVGSPRTEIPETDAKVQPEQTIRFGLAHDRSPCHAPCRKPRPPRLPSRPCRVNNRIRRLVSPRMPGPLHNNGSFFSGRFDSWAASADSVDRTSQKSRAQHRTKNLRQAWSRGRARNGFGRRCLAVSSECCRYFLPDASTRKHSACASRTMASMRHARGFVETFNPDQATFTSLQVRILAWISPTRDIRSFLRRNTSRSFPPAQYVARRN